MYPQVAQLGPVPFCLPCNRCNAHGAPPPPQRCLASLTHAELPSQSAYLLENRKGTGTKRGADQVLRYARGIDPGGLRVRTKVTAAAHLVPPPPPWMSFYVILFANHRNCAKCCDPRGMNGETEQWRNSVASPGAQSQNLSLGLAGFKDSTAEPRNPQVLPQEQERSLHCWSRGTLEVTLWFLQGESR